MKPSFVTCLDVPADVRKHFFAEVRASPSLSKEPIGHKLSGIPNFPPSLGLQGALS